MSAVTLTPSLNTFSVFVLLLSFCDFLTGVLARPPHMPSGPNILLQVPHFQRDGPSDIEERADSGLDAVTSLPPHHWQLAKHEDDIEAFRQDHNLTLVQSHAQEAAMMPSWPQAFVQYLFVAPPITYSSTSTVTVNGNVMSQSKSPGVYISMVVTPILFVAWTVSFGLTQTSKTTAGWMSVLGWSAWLSLVFEGFWPCAVPCLFQWAASLAIIIQRWRGTTGTVAYEIVDLHGCVPYDGLSYLESGARSRTYRIFQTVAFAYAVLCAAFSGGSRKSLNQGLALIAMAELILDAVVANGGTPMVVSGNCLLVELNPRLGFLNTGVSTPWKALTSFMGF